MKYLGHYLIHHKGWMDAALELSLILDENNVARAYRYTTTNEISVPPTKLPIRRRTEFEIIPGTAIAYEPDYEEVNRVDGMDFYRSLEREHVSYTHGLGYYFTWELSPPRGNTLSPWDRSARVRQL